MMKLKDWNDSFNYGLSICEELKKEGYDVVLSPYKMYDNRKGLALQVLDADKNVFKEYMSGIVETFDEMKEALRINADRIRKEL